MNYLIQQTQVFTHWHSAIRDLRAKIAIARRIERASLGNLGDIKTLGRGISEMRIDVGVGSRSRYTASKEISKRGVIMAQTLTTFDMAALLDSDEAISEYLSQVLADGDNDEFLRAIGYVAKARGMTKIATEAGVGRESLYKAFAPGAKLDLKRCSRCFTHLALTCWLDLDGAPITDPGKRKPANTISANGPPSASPTPPNTTGASAPPPIVPV